MYKQEFGVALLDIMLVIITSERVATLLKADSKATRFPPSNSVAA
jgi:hypothetical protein